MTEFVNFGAGAPVMLHGREQVLTPDTVKDLGAGFLSVRVCAEAMAESLRAARVALERLATVTLRVRLGLARDPGDWPAWARVAIRFGVKREWWAMRCAGRRAWKLYCEDVSQTGRLDTWPRFEN